MERRAHSSAPAARRQVMALRVLAAVITLLCWHSARAQSFGVWTDGHGNRKSVTCPDAREYGEVTLIPERCRVARQGALYTLELDAWVDAELVALKRYREREPEWRAAVVARDSRIAKLETALEQAGQDLADAGEQLHLAEQRANAAARMAADEAAAFDWGDAAIGAAIGGTVSAGVLLAVWLL